MCVMSDLEIGVTHKTLTTAGRRWAVRNQPTSALARVALNGADTGWPVALINAAVQIANHEAERRASTRWVTT